MAQNSSTGTETNLQTAQTTKPHPALMRLEKLVGTWDIRGRTLDSKADNISGRVIIEWMSGGFFLQQRATITILDMTVQALEILFYDPATDTFRAHVYSNVDGATPRRYEWDVQSNVVTHWTKGSKYTGTFSEDGNVLSGGWRPDKGIESNAGNTYDSMMTRVK